MPETNITVEYLAKAINHLDRKGLEQLSMLLSKEGKELLKRKKAVENKKIRTLTRSEAFDV